VAGAGAHIADDQRIGWFPVSVVVVAEAAGFAPSGKARVKQTSRFEVGPVLGARGSSVRGFRATGSGAQTILFS
jgi:hypothetical protein